MGSRRRIDYHNAGCTWCEARKSEVAGLGENLRGWLSVNFLRLQCRLHQRVDGPPFVEVEHVLGLTDVNARRR